ncbi:MAG: hypothetical protein AAGE65_11075 [Planctomycetota bacterium]
MTAKSLAFLIALNAVLLVGLFVLPGGQKTAEAQFGGGTNFTLIAGDVTGRTNQAAIYVIDLQSSRVAPMFFNGSSNEFEIFRGANVAEDAEGVGAGRR